MRRIKKILKAELAAARANLRSASLDQQMFVQSVRRDVNAGRTPPSPAEMTLSVHSQHEEDGILLLLFSLLGTTNRECVELCAGDAMECNSTNLILRHGWHGVLCDGDEANVIGARRFFSRCRATRAWPPVVEHRWLTAENVNGFVAGHGLDPQPDLLSIDVDGIDYWLWKALDVIRPRVVVIEFNHLWGATRSVTVPYSPDFKATFTRYGSDYAGASLPAMVKLGREKGYRLVATNRIATNAFFVLEDLGHSFLPERTPEGCFHHPRARFGAETRLPSVMDRPWEQV